MKIDIKKLLNYAWIVGLVFIAHYFSGFLEDMVVAGNKIAWVYLFVWYLAFISVGDMIIKHFLKWK